MRIFGVDVGEVTEVEHLTDQNGEGEDAAVVTMEIEDSALPIRQDATMQLRPRLFLEGNLFVELSPGSPAPRSSTAARCSPGADLPLRPVRPGADQPCRARAREPPDLPPGVRGRAGEVRRGEGIPGVVPDLPEAFRYTAEVNQALLGTQPGDLAGFISNFDTVVAHLDRNSADLQGLISNLNIVAGDFAATKPRFAPRSGSCPSSSRSAARPSSS